MWNSKRKNKADSGALLAEEFIRFQSENSDASDEEIFEALLSKGKYSADSINQLREMWSLWDEVDPVAPPSQQELEADHYDGTISIDEHLQLNSRRNDRGFSRYFMEVFVGNLTWKTAGRQAFGWVSAATCCLLVLMVFLEHDSSNNFLKTEIAEHKEILLDDGSTVFLGAASELEVSFSDTVRQISLLAGEASFDVMHEPERLLVVSTATLNVTALGTTFSVRDNLASVMVAVTDGSVEIDNFLNNDTNLKDFPLRLGKGASLTLNKIDGRVEINQISPENALSWYDRQLLFSNEALHDVISRVNRYTSLSIEISGPKIAQLRFSGVITPENIEGWLKALPTVFPITITNESGKVIIASKT